MFVVTRLIAHAKSIRVLTLLSYVARYKGRFERMQEIFQRLEQSDTEHNFVFTLQEASAECSWACE